MTLMKAVRLLDASIEERRSSIRNFLAEVDRVVEELTRRLREGDSVEVDGVTYAVAQKVWDNGQPVRVLLANNGVLGKRHHALKTTYASLDDNWTFAENASKVIESFASHVQEHAEEFQEAANHLRGV